MQIDTSKEGPSESEWSCVCGYSNLATVDGDRCRMCKRERQVEATTPQITLSENQWRCADCTLVNEIDWSSKYKTYCTACDAPNSTVDDLILEKRALEK